MQQQIKLDLKNPTDVGCEKCGNLYFIPVVAIKKVSAILSPTGEELKVPIQAFQCTSCQHVEMPFPTE